MTSAYGTKRTWRDVRLMSAFGGKADVDEAANRMLNEGTDYFR
jgi:hypothetical protein